MSNYNTGNPVPSIDPRDLDDNATVFDNLANGPAASYPDRLGVPRKSWAQMEADAAALFSANVTALAGLTGAADRGFYFTGLGAMTLYTFTSLGRTLAGIANQAAGRAAIGAAASGANSDITSLTGMTTALSVAQGGTGGATQAAARSGIGAAASGANSDITSLTGLTTPLSIAQGGTGSAATTATAFTLQNSWATIAGRRNIYRKVVDTVIVELNIQSGTATDGTVVATLPAGFRPASAITVPATAIAQVATGTSQLPPRLIVGTDGTIQVQNCTNAAVFALFTLSTT